MKKTESTENRAVGTLYALDNLGSSDVHVFDPSSAPPEPERACSKAAQTVAWASQDTEDVFISGFAGLNPGARVCRDNPPAFMYAVVCDYDTPISDADRESLLAGLKRKPSYISRSYSGGTHTVYVFEERIPIYNSSAYIQTLLSKVRKDLGLDGLFGELDVGAFLKPYQYYHRGWGFRAAGGLPIPAEMTYSWFDAAIKKINWSYENLDLPLEKVEEMIRQKWSEALASEPLRVGTRCRRFWDPGADNPSAAVCTEKGFVCYTGDVPFMSWRELLGNEECCKAKFEGEARALKCLYYAQKHFYYRPEQGKMWQSLDMRGAELVLATQFGLDPHSVKGSLSQVKKVIGRIIELNSVREGVPVLYCDGDRIEIDGVPYLNTGRTRALTPADSGGEAWGDRFAWIAQFLDRLLGEEQKDYFLSWLARAYQGALRHAPTRGQAIFIAGAQSSGKTFLSKVIIGPLLGGRADATEYLTGATRFNGYLFDCGVWAIDDATALADVKSHERYSAMVKRMAANEEFNIEAKFKNAVKLPWLGRVVVTLNVDGQSAEMLPVTDISNRDKLMFFKTCDEPLNDPGAEAHVRKELRYFARYLSKYETPEECRGSERYGVKGWLHPELLATAQSRGTTELFREGFVIFLKNYFSANTKGDELRETAMRILALMTSDAKCGAGMPSDLVSSRSIGRRLARLSETGEFPLHRKRTAAGTLWIVKREEFEVYRKAAEEVLPEVGEGAAESPGEVPQEGQDGGSDDIKSADGEIAQEIS